MSEQNVVYHRFAFDFRQWQMKGIQNQFQEANKFSM